MKPQIFHRHKKKEKFSEEYIADEQQDILPNEKSILIIDDDTKFVEILVDLATHKGFKCLTAYDGQSGIKLAQQYNPSAIILDIGLPAGDGLDVMRRLATLAQTAFVPVIIVTGRDDSATKKQSLEAGAKAFLQKPVEQDELLDAIEKILISEKKS